MAIPTKVFSLSSLLMAALFAYSASVQLNDPDWYFWYTLYACASVVNLIHGIFSSIKVRETAQVAFCLGLFLFVKVAIEDFVNGISGLWSLDLGERLVREKIGSGLAVISMLLQLEATSTLNDRAKRNKMEVSRSVNLGMVLLVVVSYGFSFVFFMIRSKGRNEDLIKGIHL